MASVVAPYLAGLFCKLSSWNNEQAARCQAKLEASFLPSNSLLLLHNCPDLEQLSPGKLGDDAELLRRLKVIEQEDYARVPKRLENGKLGPQSSEIPLALACFHNELHGHSYA